MYHGQYNRLMRWIYRSLWVLLLCTLGSYFLHTTFFSGIDREEPSPLTVLGAKLLNANGRIKRVLFSPDDNIGEVLIALIRLESKRIILASYVITDVTIARALIEAHKRRVRVEIVSCRSGTQDRWSKVKMLAQAGIPVYIYPADFVHSLMHNKFVVFERISIGRLNLTVTATGSFNMTRAASRANQENFLFLDDTEIARAFLERFEILKRLSILLKAGRDSVN